MEGAASLALRKMQTLRANPDGKFCIFRNQQQKIARLRNRDELSRQPLARGAVAVPHNDRAAPRQLSRRGGGFGQPDFVRQQN